MLALSQTFKGRLLSRPLESRVRHGIHTSVTSQGHGKGHRRTSTTMRSLIMGSPGAGKGTQTKRIAQRFDIITLSSGDLLRKNIMEESALGLEARAYIEEGGLVPDELVVELILKELSTLKGKSWMLDGFPRTLSQAKILDAHLKEESQPLDLVLNLDVPEGVILQRIIDRWIHPASGRTYNMSYNPPKRVGFDDVTGEPLAKRPDDNVETFKHRLDKYYELTRPLLSYYQVQGILRNFQGSTSDQLYPLIQAELETYLN
ncbi:adenylate kinase [Spizellomyces punctatus DAOM BR117]|uniref:GTP:AMP phosphotransferase, mitochondrial n=1 Tax=Spizellomyces punctatus (strain DAOM BR117) TaxID=645134 RepID=A0A0L0HA75_SPIPD|nr:adenylate kinase [Spizellomyces punctatus DAOM BR117]KNC97921.1 adenylate kinase [Spizellomyces punctatus DAOM BR117]|eukprot:XP_016605961.1 adenylate kinase [Spizellomyces punctatus DAOM BR117]